MPLGVIPLKKLEKKPPKIYVVHVLSSKNRICCYVSFFIQNNKLKNALYRRPSSTYAEVPTTTPISDVNLNIVSLEHFFNNSCFFKRLARVLCPINFFLLTLPPPAYQFITTMSMYTYMYIYVSITFFLYLTQNRLQIQFKRTALVFLYTPN